MNRKITEKPALFKALARQTLIGHWQTGILFCLLLQLIQIVPALIFELVPLFQISETLAWIINLYSMAVMGPLTLSFAKYFLNIFRQENSEINKENIEYGFKNFARALILYLRILVFIWLWSLLFVIPGIIASLRYSQSFFILSENPEKHPAKCMYESCVIMNGNLLKYFELRFSFIGWYILAEIPTIAVAATKLIPMLPMLKEALLQGQLYGSYTAEIFNSPIITILGLISVIVSLYDNVSCAAFYEVLTGKLVVQTENASGINTNEQNC